jgi:hypothetical protein
MKRLNPKTGVPFALGDVREDGFIFQAYKRTCLREDGMFVESWLAPETYFRARVSISHRKAYLRAEEDSSPFDIDVEYLLSIYPRGGICPILKTPMVFGGERWNSPSLDRFIPELGYVRGNVCWISDKANTIKQDITDPTVFLAIANYVSGCTTQHNIEVPQ